MKLLLTVLIVGLFFAMGNPLAFASENDTDESWTNSARQFMSEMHPEFSSEEIDERIENCHGNRSSDNQRQNRPSW
ncbi:hypothetical protein SAMN05421734_101263 [Pelagirhabdus alkalitolerans]|uniref:Uncharacterized protein n=1 Tax=Pelagirhabdus alkalitolerans TaxID=1612202 RepID=A0A1G6GLR3_9BACI|nr:hypothetical protein [Pelagirhabdus alkalitolerans]SDB82958.1 hypothetical protein SAMN05421734_101263 [Pelagirhabdus alkalitolerans]